ncbi:hypothetical protein ACGFNX_43715 [Streptomyces sp. NPDC048723]|uniref:hypothetical protein n=1 Tax=Streptomyces sp. NPDC048723 TaxID=3365589 RepID=UPI00371E53CA
MFALESAESVFIKAMMCERHEMPVGESRENRLVVQVGYLIEADLNISLELCQLFLAWFQDLGQNEKPAELMDGRRLLQSVESLV